MKASMQHVVVRHITCTRDHPPVKAHMSLSFPCQELHGCADAWRQQGLLSRPPPVACVAPVPCCLRYPGGESYLDLVCRLWPVVAGLQAAGGPVVVVAHQAVLRVLLGLLLRRPLQDMPAMDIPLHTVIQLTPTPGGGSYHMTALKPTRTEQQTGAPAVTAAEPVAAAAQAAPGFNPTATPLLASRASGRRSSCVAATAAAHAAVGHVGPALAMRHWRSCSSEVVGLQPATSSGLAGSRQVPAACST